MPIRGPRDRHRMGVPPGDSAATHRTLPPPRAGPSQPTIYRMNHGISVLEVSALRGMTRMLTPRSLRLARARMRSLAARRAQLRRHRRHARQLNARLCPARAVRRGRGFGARFSAAASTLSSLRNMRPRSLQSIFRLDPLDHNPASVLFPKLLSTPADPLPHPLGAARRRTGHAGRECRPRPNASDLSESRPARPRTLPQPGHRECRACIPRCPTRPGAAHRSIGTPVAPPARRTERHDSSAAAPAAGRRRETTPDGSAECAQDRC